MAFFEFALRKFFFFIDKHAYLKQLMAVTLLTIEAKNATAVVNDVTNIDGTACFIVSCTSLIRPPVDIFCCLPDSQTLQNIKASSAPIPTQIDIMQKRKAYSSHIAIQVKKSWLRTDSYDDRQQIHEWKESDPENESINRV